MTLPRERNGDAVALFAMLRNVAGSIGISLSTAMVTQRAAAHQNFMTQWASPFHQPYVKMVDGAEKTLRGMGHTAVEAHNMALGGVYQTIRTQTAIMAYSDVFVYCAIVAFAVVPFCFLMTSKKSGGGPGAAH
jgi:DHA2 family multidrug resistance protein